MSVAPKPASVPRCPANDSASTKGTSTAATRTMRLVSASWPSSSRAGMRTVTSAKRAAKARVTTRPIHVVASSMRPKIHES